MKNTSITKKQAEAQGWLIITLDTGLIVANFFGWLNGEMHCFSKHTAMSMPTILKRIALDDNARAARASAGN